MELLLPMAAKKLDLSFNIQPDVPPCMATFVSTHRSKEYWLVIGVYADYARIRQGAWHTVQRAPWLMTICSVDESYRQRSEVYSRWISPSALFRWRPSRGVGRSQSQVRDSVSSTSLTSLSILWPYFIVILVSVSHPPRSTFYLCLFSRLM
jgi:hypothetical protein